MSIIPRERIEPRIYLMRGYKVILDRDLAELYGVQTKVLNQAVKRNILRLPSEFMFQLNEEEFKIWITQAVISRSDQKGLRKSPFAFTEHGVAMLSSVLHSKRAIHVNIQIIQAFIRMRDMLLSHDELRLRLDALEQRYDEQFHIVFDAMRRVLTEDESEKPLIGFRTNHDEAISTPPTTTENDTATPGSRTQGARSESRDTPLPER